MDVRDDSRFKRPESVLVVVHSAAGKVLLLRRRDHNNFWQSVTGSLSWDEPDARSAARRELEEETGIDAGDALTDLGLSTRYEIYPEWRHRYAPGVVENLEHAYAVKVPHETAPQLCAEHSEYGWFDFAEAMRRVTSRSNREAIRRAMGRFDTVEAVVLAHGLWLSGWAMGLLARRVRAAGFHTHLFSYPSVNGTLRENAERLYAFSRGIAADKIHFVGHSLGGVVIQAMLSYCTWRKDGRIVTLGSPHAGSVVATAFAPHRWGRGMLGKSILDLARTDRIPCDLYGREVGVIKGARSFGLGRFFSRLSAPNDGVVTVDEAVWSGARDTITLPVAHTEMLWSRDVARNVVAFLRNGRFDH